jgi:hypothetical protein
MSFEVWKEITVEYEGRDINGSGFLTPEQLAKKLIRDLASQGLA